MKGSAALGASPLVLAQKFPEFAALMISQETLREVGRVKERQKEKKGQMACDYEIAQGSRKEQEILSVDCCGDPWAYVRVSASLMSDLMVEFLV